MSWRPLPRDITWYVAPSNCTRSRLGMHPPPVPEPEQVPIARIGHARWPGVGEPGGPWRMGDLYLYV